MKMLIVILLLATMLLGACRQALPSEPEPTTYQKIQEFLTNLQTYRAIATVEYISNKGSNSYETIQHGRISGEYRIEITAPENLAGHVTSSDGQHIYQFNTRVNGRVTILARESKERSEIFLTSFINNWQASQTTSVAVTNIDDGQFTVLEAIIPGEHPYLAAQFLWFCNNTLLPVKLVIQDPSGTERVIVTYHNFEYNVELGDALFTV